MKKIFCVFFCATFAIISSKTAYGQNTEDVDALISEFYNNFTSEESNRTIKEKIEQLINKYSLPSFTLKQVFDDCRKQLVDFKIMKPDDKA